MSLEGGAGLGEGRRVVQAAGQDADEGGKTFRGSDGGGRRQGGPPLSEEAVGSLEGAQALQEEIHGSAAVFFPAPGDGPQGLYDVIVFQVFRDNVAIEVGCHVHQDGVVLAAIKGGMSAGGMLQEGGCKRIALLSQGVVRSSNGRAVGYAVQGQDCIKSLCIRKSYKSGGSEAFVPNISEQFPGRGIQIRICSRKAMQPGAASARCGVKPASGEPRRLRLDQLPAYQGCTRM